MLDWIAYHITCILTPKTILFYMPEVYYKGYKDKKYHKYFIVSPASILSSLMSKAANNSSAELK